MVLNQNVRKPEKKLKNLVPMPRNILRKFIENFNVKNGNLNQLKGF